MELQYNGTGTKFNHNIKEIYFHWIKIYVDYILIISIIK